MYSRCPLSVRCSLGRRILRYRCARSSSVARDSLAEKCRSGLRHKLIKSAVNYRASKHSPVRQKQPEFSGQLIQYLWASLSIVEHRRASVGQYSWQAVLGDYPHKFIWFKFFIVRHVNYRSAFVSMYTGLQWTGVPARHCLAFDSQNSNPDLHCGLFDADLIESLWV